MRALVAAPESPDRIALREVGEPIPTENQAIVAVEAISLNRGEVNGLMTASSGWRPGWDIAGTVIRAADDGTGPKLNARVVGFTPGGGWAERVAVGTGYLAELPDNVSFAAAATLPVAGLTALRALRLGETLAGDHVLITGASGGVGRYAVQLAARENAQVTAIVGNQERIAGLRALGAFNVVVDIESLHEPFDVILESVGGTSLAAALKLVAPGGSIISFGNSSREPTTFNVSTFFGKSGARLVGFVLPAPGAEPFAADLTFLVTLLASEQLDSQISFEGSWRTPGEAIAALRDRQIIGKAVLHID